MNTSVLAVLALGTAAVVTPAAHAGEPVPGPGGLACGVYGAAVGGDYTDVLSGGPFVGDGTLTCTIQHGVATHDGPDTVARSASGTGVVVLAPEQVTYTLSEPADTYLCTQWTPLGGDPIYFHHDPEGPDGNHWSEDPASACSLARSAGTSGEPNVLDTTVCPLFVLALQGSAAGGNVTVAEDGDVAVAGRPVWDCPPYGG